MKDTIKTVPFQHPLRDLSHAEMIARAKAFEELMSKRRTIRTFSDKPVPVEIIESCIRTAGTAPSGAHKQPWHFAVVTDNNLKKRIRAAAEEEESTFYDHRAPDEWLEALRPFGTDAHKPFLETAPYLIAIFARAYDVHADKSRSKNYYVPESVGIATGFLIAALHQAGLSTLTHTPSPMGFLNHALERPANERAVILLVVGHASELAAVPDLSRKSLPEIASFHGTDKEEGSDSGSGPETRLQ